MICALVIGLSPCSKERWLHGEVTATSYYQETYVRVYVALVVASTCRGERPGRGWGEEREGGREGGEGIVYKTTVIVVVGVV